MTAKTFYDSVVYSFRKNNEKHVTDLANNRKRSIWNKDNFSKVTKQLLYSKHLWNASPVINTLTTLNINEHLCMATFIFLFKSLHTFELYNMPS